jgi:carboxyl-terminal processing protease
LHFREQSINLSLKFLQELSNPGADLSIKFAFTPLGVPMKLSFPSQFFRILLTLIFALAAASFVAAQDMDSIERARMKDMLTTIKKDIKNNYYDPNFHGIDLDKRFKEASDKLDKTTSSNQGLGIIAQVLMDFNDSHLAFIPPPKTLAVEYGWRMQAIGDKVFITKVKPGSDADQQGVKPGDQILAVNNFPVSRKELWKIDYYYNVLSKRDKLILSLLSPGQEKPRDVALKAQLKNLQRTITFTQYYRLGEGFYNEENDKQRWAVGPEVTIWKSPDFEYDPNLVDGYVGRAKNSGTLILDLRGNPGGYVKTMEGLVGNVIDHDVVISQEVGRKKTEPSKSKSRGKSAFQGKLIVLIDSDSASASEVFARAIQLEKRGVVLGDASAGAVMTSRTFGEEHGDENVVAYGASIPIADVIMADGKSLEHVGVTPDELILPTPADMAAGRDPVLARALELAGAKMAPDDINKLYKYYW